jgi:Queuine tRNA-ribosyltransferase
MRAGELTGLRLVTQHNLWFIARLMDDLRAGIDSGRLGEVAAALRGGAAPGAFAGAGRADGSGDGPGCKTPETPRPATAIGT